MFAQLTRERHRKVLSGIHKDLAEERFKSTDIFGEDVVDRIKKHHDALKTLRRSSSLFRRVAPKSQTVLGVEKIKVQ